MTEQYLSPKQIAEQQAAHDAAMLEYVRRLEAENARLLAIVEMCPGCRKAVGR